VINVDNSTWAALIGSAIGGLAGILPTLAGQHFLIRRELMLRDVVSREQLYEEFIKEASTRYVDSLQRSLTDPAIGVMLFSLIGRIRLVSSVEVLKRAEEVGELIIVSYDQPPVAITENFAIAKKVDLLLNFTRACREERAHIIRKMSSLYIFERTS
jgi:hypothetical protein